MNTFTGFGLLALASDNQWFDNPAIEQKLWPALLETLQMTGVATLVAVLFGLPLGLLLVDTSPRGQFPNRLAYQTLSIIINIGRSVPFIILLIALIPVTRAIVGTSLGWQAATVPLSIGAIPFFARLSETAFLSVSQGKVEAALMMGASTTQIMGGVRVRESLPALIQGVTVTAVTLVGYSSIAGVVGAGGLGNLAILYGYNRYQLDVMIVSVVLIVLVVQVIQSAGDMLSRWVDHR